MTTWTKSGRWSKKSRFLSAFRVKNVHVEVGGDQKREKGGKKVQESISILKVHIQN